MPEGGCALCPRRCGARRERAAGVCHADAVIRLGRAAPHFGEEPCISGQRGSGAVFFSGCPLGCVYCQNYRLSRGLEGERVTVEELAEIFRSLERSGVHNLNMVTGTQFAPEILRALELAEPKIPVVWNSSGYETEETVRTLSKRVQIFLPDMKYALADPAARYSRAPDYPETARAAIREMVRLTGPYELDEEGMLRRGVLIRHLVLPGQGENTRRVIRWVDETFAPGEVLFSLMAQYTPCGELGKTPELDRTLTAAEWEEALAALDESGITDGFVQDLDAAGEEQIPAFDGTGVK
ncbi:MAG: radical SAM protein [Oscillospiraceae bacterium]|nr:radical SAM protein [Oscillospiraceae bacterium]